MDKQKHIIGTGTCHALSDNFAVTVCDRKNAIVKYYSVKSKKTGTFCSLLQR